MLSTSVLGRFVEQVVDESERSLSTRVEARRSQRVMLRIPILVRAEIKGEPPLEEDTFTMVVNAHGALIALAMKVRPGQKLDLRNWGTAKEQACRVVHVKNNPFGKNEVGIEFPFPNPHFWNLDFPHPIGSLFWSESSAACQGVHEGSFHYVYRRNPEPSPITEIAGNLAKDLAKPDDSAISITICSPRSH